MIEIKPTSDFLNPLISPKLFLGGAIENGEAEQWQIKVVNALKKYNGIIFNPRRDDWDSSWKQSLDNPRFKEQVEWEYKAQEASDILFYYFHPDCKCPITLMELGLFAHRNTYGGKIDKRIIVCCPNEFWRAGNVDFVCRQFGIERMPDLDSAIEKIRYFVGGWND